MMTADFFFVLASGSPRRREFMEILGVPFTVVTPSQIGEEVDETPLTGETPPALVQRLSHSKAAAVAKHIPFLTPPLFIPPAGQTAQQGIVIAADTVVVLDDEILGKPQNPDDARQMLKKLRLAPHAVYTGFALAVLPAMADKLLISAGNGPTEPTFITRLHHSRVTMRPYTEAEIDAYVASGDPLDKAGAYGIQNSVFAPVGRLDGCFASVMGLPLGSLAEAMREIGLPLPPVGPRCYAFTGHSCCQQ